MTLDRFLCWADKRQFLSVRALCMYVTLGGTTLSFHWAGQYAYVAMNSPGLETAAVIAAVTAPITALQLFVFKWYSESRAGDKDGTV